MRYLLKLWMDFDQTCIYTLLGGGEKYIKFGELDLVFKVTSLSRSPSLKNCQISLFWALSSEPVGFSLPNLN